MFEKLQQASRLNDNGSFPYLRSHPLTTERIADMQLARAIDWHVLGRQLNPPWSTPWLPRAPGCCPTPGWICSGPGAPSPEPTGFARPERARAAAAVLYAAALAAERLREVRPAATALASRLLTLDGRRIRQRRGRRDCWRRRSRCRRRHRPRRRLAGSPLAALASSRARPELLHAGAARTRSGPGPHRRLTCCRPGWPRTRAMPRPGRHCRRLSRRRTRRCARCGPRAKSRWRV